MRARGRARDLYRDGVRGRVPKSSPSARACGSSRAATISEQSLGSATRIDGSTHLAQRERLSPRKRPRQRRSAETVDAIVEAGARVFAEGGYGRASTNRIAQAAGVSIGSLYEYFPNKDAILVAVAERHLGRMMSDVEDLLLEAQGEQEELESLLARFVVAMLDIHERDPNLHHVVSSEAPHPPELHACVLQMEETLARLIDRLVRATEGVLLDDTDTAAHFVVQTTEALTHRFAHQGIHDLPRERFVTEVVALLDGYLRRGAGRALGA
jgi:AcrR family transcriptional regulator